MASRDLQNRFFFYFGSVSVRFLKNLNWAENEFGSVRILQLFSTRVIVEQLIYSKYYSDGG